MQKKILISLIILFLILGINSCSFAKIYTNFVINESAGQEVIEPAGIALGTVQVVGTIISVIMLTVIGLKYMFGSVEEKAANKSTIIYYIIGAVLIFVTSNIAYIIYDLIKNGFNNV